MSGWKVPALRAGVWRPALAVFLSLGFLFTSANAFAVTQEQIDAARSAERMAEMSVAQIEVRLAAARTEANSALVAAQLAAEDLNEAEVLLQEAADAAAAAQSEADEAQARFEEGKEELATVAQSAFRGGTNALDPLAPYLTSDGLQSLETQRNIIDSFGSAADSKLQNVAALEQVALVMAESAQRAKEAEEAAVEEVSTKLAEAEAASVSAQQVQAATEIEHEALLNELAVKQNTTVELVRTQQQEAQQRIEEAERQAALERTEQQAQTNPAPTTPPASNSGNSSGSSGNSGSSGGNSTPTPAPTPTPTPTPTPAPVVPAPAPKPTPAPPSSLSGIEAVIESARSKLGAPYVWGGEGPGYDCSGLVTTSFATIGVYLTHQTKSQWDQTARVSVGNAQRGDLIFWSSNGARSGIYHVAIYLGDGQIIEAATYGVPLRITSIYNWGSVIGAGRVI